MRKGQISAFDDLDKKHAAEIENIKKTYINKINDTYQNAYQKGAEDKENKLKQEYKKKIIDMAIFEQPPEKVKQDEDCF
jgi:hypothetical protein